MEEVGINIVFTLEPELFVGLITSSSLSYFTKDSIFLSVAAISATASALVVYDFYSYKFFSQFDRCFKRIAQLIVFGMKLALCWVSLE